jgi:hypothetical protein
MCPFSGKGRGYRPDEIDQAIEFIESLDVVIGHNMSGFDILAIQKFYPDFKVPDVFDTLVLSRMIDPARLMHGLKSYGIQFDNQKGVFGGEEESWEEFSEEMFVYNKQDVVLNIEVYTYLCEKAGFDPTRPPAYK